MKNLTPDNMKCGSVGCQAVYGLDDGRLLIIGEQGVVKAIVDLNKPLGDDESAIIIDRELLANVLKR